MPTQKLQQSLFLKACRREPVATTPIWLMRQAGRYMSEYMAVRNQVSFLELCKRPDLSAEVTLTAREILGVDAAILFSDLLPILEPMGLHLEYAQGEGPVIHNPIRTSTDVDRFHAVSDMSSLDFVFETVKRVRKDLPADIPLIGFAGAPFTLASYAIEGGGSRHYLHTKKLMHGDAAAWDAVMSRLTDSLINYLRAQIEAGCQAVQIFDSWAGCLSPHDYRTHVLRYSKKIIDALPADVPLIHFATGNPALLPVIRETGGAVIGLDWRVDFDAGWEMVGRDRAVQGNLDPVLLFADWPVIQREAKRILDEAACRPGHIFNLGHGILPGTDPEKVKSLVKFVHDYSAELAASR
ncbi:MAG: uroporphyrinogen decarboxylase [Planctomycetota bacterium]|nr:uroporphyrinogen decarboxylase [Planctomycetota bacterium]MDA1214996.1 uroporphyrinogen decarboxylase [Planctomycetota bacterium]